MRLSRYLLPASIVVLLAGLACATPASAQLPGVGKTASPIAQDQPVFYQADNAEYDREAGVVTLTGHVEFWQNGRALLADKVTFDRNTNVAAAQGNVVVLEPDGQTLFAEYAELGAGLKDGVLSGMRALLAEGGKLAANGARRTDAKLNELSRVVYSTCDLCKEHPERAPLWQIRAREAIQDIDNKRIEYSDAVIDFFGIPVAYFPFLTHPDPSEKRASGLLVPSFGYSKRLGTFTSVPYYWVIDGQSDATIAPLVASKNGPGLNLEYRRRFNSGTMTIDGSLARYDDTSKVPSKAGAGWSLFAKGQFAIDDTWRWGFDINRASANNYLRDFQVQGRQDLLTSQVYLEGFGQGSYSRLDVRAYQGLTNTIVTEKLPYVLPRYQYSFSGEKDPLGGRLSLDAGAFNVLRDVGTNTQRANLSLNWDRPAIGTLGDVWQFTLHMDSAAYVASQFSQQPNYGQVTGAQSTQGMPTMAAMYRWPLLRDAGGWGTQLIEPIAQVIVAPRGSSYSANNRIPNEDSLDQDFTDSNLFALNRFPGVDRLEGGPRANVALHARWTFPNGALIDGQIGQAYRLQPDTAFDKTSGLRDTASDIVSHVTFAPSSWLDVTGRQRFDRKTQQIRFADAIATAGVDAFRVNGGYIYTTTNPFFLYDTAPTAAAVLTKPRNEGTVGFSTGAGQWKGRGYARRDLSSGKMVSVGVGATYDDECFTFDINLFRRYVSVNNDSGATTVLFQITLKTVGQFGFHAL
jgi:LPS-assembly protein